MEINETTVLDDRGFIQISGDEAKDFLQNIVTNDIDKISTDLTLFSSILTPQGKYLYEFFILKIGGGYLLECEKKIVSEIIKIFNFYKLRSKVNHVSSKGNSVTISYTDIKNTKEEKIEVDKVLVSVGRKPYTEGLNLSKVGIKKDKKGRIEVNSKLQTSLCLR